MSTVNVTTNGKPLPATATTAEIVDAINAMTGGFYTGYVPANTVSSNLDVLGTNATIIWVLIAGFLVFFMHAGFSMLETGCITSNHAINILFKNIGTVCIGGVMYYLLGYGFAFGLNNAGYQSSKFIGNGDYALYQTSDPAYSTSVNRHFWFFQFAFAATAATIVSGAMAGRMNLVAYFCTAAVMTSFVYPVVSHWVWSGQGWISAFAPNTFLSSTGGCGMVDFAGSGVVHLTGGIAALCGIFVLGPRLGRFDSDGNDTGNLPPHNLILCTLGTFILWFGWYGFNCGSTLLFDGAIAAKVAVTTTIAPSMAGTTAIVAGRFIYGHFDLGFVLNSVLGGLVAITAGCATVDDWASLIIGFIAAFVYLGTSILVKKLQLDDVVDAVAVHAANGMWGVLAAGIFSTPYNLLQTYGKVCDGWSSGTQFATQLIGMITIIAWVAGLMLPFFYALKHFAILRVSPEDEELGLDHSEHGGMEAFQGAKTSSQSIKFDDQRPTEGNAVSSV